jgi:hypothetical protein
MFAVTFDTGGMASTLDPSEVCENHDGDSAGHFSRTHADGWTISGTIHEDWYCWVNSFEAHHPVFGAVWGDFEGEVCADSELGYNAFYRAHGPKFWDYQDI